MRALSPLVVLLAKRYTKVQGREALTGLGPAPVDTDCTLVVPFPANAGPYARTRCLGNWSAYAKDKFDCFRPYIIVKRQD